MSSTPSDEHPLPITPDTFSTVEQDAARALIKLGVDEDLSDGDITSETLISPEVEVDVEVVPREDGVLCGLPVVAELFRSLEPAMSLRPFRTDGDRIRPGEPVLRLSGPGQPVLRGERLALNFLQRLSGIATATRAVVDAVRGTAARIYDTRKTTPGWRVLEKYAVRVGGGNNHRMDLSEFALIKDNHREILQRCGGGDMNSAIERLRAEASGVSVEVEVDSLDGLASVLDSLPEIVLLDNFSLDDLRAAVAMVRGRSGDAHGDTLLEASGGITIANVREVAETGVDRIALGAITHSAPALDLGLDFVEVRSS